MSFSFSWYFFYALCLTYFYSSLSLYLGVASSGRLSLAVSIPSIAHGFSPMSFCSFTPWSLWTTAIRMWQWGKDENRNPNFPSHSLEAQSLALIQFPLSSPAGTERDWDRTISLHHHFFKYLSVPNFPSSFTSNLTAFALESMVFLYSQQIRNGGWVPWIVPQGGLEA